MLKRLVRRHIGTVIFVFVVCLHVYFPELFEFMRLSKPVGRWGLIIIPALIYFALGIGRLRMGQKLSANASKLDLVNAYGGFLLCTVASAAWAVTVYFIYFGEQNGLQ